MMEETEERFLRAIGESIAPERVREVHLFSAIRQGGRESRVAVIAAEPEPAATGDAETSSAEHSTTPRRLTIYRAHYQLVLKGAERGTWEVDVHAEADAPIETVDDVVRGVHRRSGDEAEPERLTGDAFRAALSGPPCAAPVSPSRSR
ncbi:MAG TPA: hypothetical protein VFW98_12590 [Gemmatimonadaceae bacterium]|nr:hypothetical protein [Gemmatimonadaceae bacterium]